MDLSEKKLSDLGKVGKVSDMQKAAHSQGIDLGKDTRTAHHIDFHDAKHRGKNAGAAKMQSGKVIGGSANKDKLTNATLATKVRDSVIDRQKKATGSDNPGAWKKGSGQLRKGADPKAKEDRKSEMRAAREKKYADRNKGFSRTENKPDARRKKVFEEFMSDCYDALTED